MKEVIKKELQELWFFIKFILIVSGVFFWIITILWKINDVL